MLAAYTFIKMHIILSTMIMQLKCLQNKLQKCEMALIFVKAFYFIMFTKIPLCRS